MFDLLLTYMPLYTMLFILTFSLLAIRSRKNLERLRNELKDLEEQPRTSHKEQVSFKDQVKKLLVRDDISLRLLEEMYISEYYELIYFRIKREPINIRALEILISDIRGMLKEFIEHEQFPHIRECILQLIDQAQAKLDTLLEQKPFEGLDEPEKSLLMDIQNSIPEENSISRQKTLQLADIIKAKYHDTMQLQLENSKSAIWSRWGTYGTIFFGILSLFLSFMTQSV